MLSIIYAKIHGLIKVVIGTYRYSIKGKLVE